MLNLLLIDHAPIMGGSEAFLLDLLTVLNRQRYRPHIVTDPQGVALKEFRATGEPLLLTTFPQLNRKPLFLPLLLKAGWQLAQAAKAANADLLHTFTARTHLIGAVASRLSGIPLVWRLGDDTLSPNILRWFASAPACIVGVSRWINAQYPNLKLDGLVPDGARAPLNITSEAARAELHIPTNAKVVAHVGRLVRWKGQRVFIEALAQVRQSVPDVYGLIVGSWHESDDVPGLLGGGKPYADELRTLAFETGLNTTLDQRVIFTGFIRDPGLGYAAADVVVHSSTLPEPFGRVVIEAMMMSRPVVAVNAGGPAEVVLHGQTGYLTPLGDAAELAHALIRLLSDDALRQRFGVAAQQRAQNEYSLSIMARNMEAAYEIALKKAHK